jgi:hypothetical protein
MAPVLPPQLIRDLRADALLETNIPILLLLLLLLHLCTCAVRQPLRHLPRSSVTCRQTRY